MISEREYGQFCYYSRHASIIALHARRIPICCTRVLLCIITFMAATCARCSALLACNPRRCVLLPAGFPLALPESRFFFFFFYFRTPNGNVFGPSPFCSSSGTRTDGGSRGGSVTLAPQSATLESTELRIIISDRV